MNKKEQWGKIEKNVNEAEKAQRKAHESSNALHNETDLTYENRQKMSQDEILDKAKRKRVAQKAMETERSLEEKSVEVLGSEDSLENSLVELRMKNLFSAIRKESEIDKKRKNLLHEKIEIIKGSGDELNNSEIEALDEIEQEAQNLTNDKKELLQSSPEAYFGLHLKEMKEYKKSLETGKIIETPSVKKIKEEVIEAIEIGKPPFLYGHMGTGKTEFARCVARELTGKEALFFSGSKETSKAELMGHLSLHKGEMPKTEELVEMTDKEIESFDSTHPDLNDNERRRKHKIISNYVMEREKTGTETSFDFGPVYKAMKEGTPLIIDELNMIPHSVLGRLNDLLIKKPGDSVDVQEDGVPPFKIKEGFFFLMTGNLNTGIERYERQDLDPAGLRRYHPVKYDYLPQYREKKENDSLNLEENAGADNELFQIMLAKVMNKQGNIEVPEGSVEKIWRLAMGARLSQDIFAGRAIKKPQIGGKRAVAPYFLKKINLDLGRVDTILSAWTKNGKDKDLDFYVWRYGIGEAVDEMDRAFLFQVFKNTYGFFNGWKSNEEDILSGKAQELDVEIPEKEIKTVDKKIKTVGKKKDFFTPRDLVEFAYGKAPERAKWPDVAAEDKEENIKSDNLEILANGQKFIKEFEDNYNNELIPVIDEYIKENPETNV